MLDRRNRAEPYRELAEGCRRLATSTPSGQIKNRYLLMAQDYIWLADLKEQAYAYRTPTTVEENAALAATITGRVPGPWRIVEITHGFAVDDATGQQLAVFYGLAEPNTARQTDFLTIDEARQMAVNFAKLPELLEQTSGLSEVATSPEDNRLTKLETNRSAQGTLETWHLPRVAQLPAVAGLPLAEMPTSVPKFTSFEPDEWMSTLLAPRPSGRLSNRTKSLIAIAIAVAALPAGYFIVRNSDHPVDVAAVPQATTDIPPAEFLPLREAQAPAAAAAGTNVESRVEPEVQAAPLQQTAPLDTKPTENGIKAKPPPMLREEGSFAAGRDASTCFPSASAVRESRPGAWPSWTLRAPGHEGTRCWYAATRTTTHDHR
jgi:alkylhydroperoxidase/carboxymuconolactone decarboxylase family protein YurZ